MVKTAKVPQNGMIRVAFSLPANEPSGAVSVVGDFNEWNPFSH